MEEIKENESYTFLPLFFSTVFRPQNSGRCWRSGSNTTSRARSAARICSWFVACIRWPPPSRRAARRSAHAPGWRWTTWTRSAPYRPSRDACWRSFDAAWPKAGRRSTSSVVGCGPSTKARSSTSTTRACPTRTDDDDGRRNPGVTNFWRPNWTNVATHQVCN